MRVGCGGDIGGRSGRDSSGTRHSAFLIGETILKIAGHRFALSLFAHDCVLVCVPGTKPGGIQQSYCVRRLHGVQMESRITKSIGDTL